MGSAVSAPTFSCASTTRAVLVLLGELSCGADDLIDKASQIHRLGIELEFAGFDSRDPGLASTAQALPTSAYPTVQLRARGTWIGMVLPD
jgi:hypothetical protein